MTESRGRVDTTRWNGSAKHFISRTGFSNQTFDFEEVDMEMRY